MFSVSRTVEIGETRRATTEPRYDRSNRHGTRDWRIFITLSRCPGPPKDVHRGRWSRFQAVAIRARRRKGGSRDWFVRLTIIRSPLRVWHYFSIADYSRGYFMRGCPRARTRNFEKTYNGRAMSWLLSLRSTIGTARFCLLFRAIILTMTSGEGITAHLPGLSARLPNHPVTKPFCARQ